MIDLARSRAAFNTGSSIAARIAIIAILAAMLLPVLNQARDKAKQAKCISNLKQCVTGALMYAGDYKDMLPAATFQSVGATWTKRLGQLGYLPVGEAGRPGIFVCPAFAPFSYKNQDETYGYWTGGCARPNHDAVDWSLLGKDTYYGVHEKGSADDHYLRLGRLESSRAFIMDSIRPENRRQMAQTSRPVIAHKRREVWIVSSVPFLFPAPSS